MQDQYDCGGPMQQPSPPKQQIGPQQMVCSGQHWPDPNGVSTSNLRNLPPPQMSLVQWNFPVPPQPWNFSSPTIARTSKESDSWTGGVPRIGVRLKIVRENVIRRPSLGNRNITEVGCQPLGHIVMYRGGYSMWKPTSLMIPVAARSVVSSWGNNRFTFGLGLNIL